MPTIRLLATPLTFAEYQLIHQRQQQQWQSDSASRKPVTSDSLKDKLKFWLVSVCSLGSFYFLLGVEHFGGWLLIGSLFTGLGLLYQWWEYRQAFQQYRRQPQPLSFQLSEAGLAVEWSQGWQHSGWQSLVRVQRVDNWLLVYPGPDFCYYLNLRQVLPPHTSTDVAALLDKAVSTPAATFASR